jgi:hypothetical protein
LLDDTHNVDLTAQDLELIEAALHTHEKILSVQSRAGGGAARARLNALKGLMHRLRRQTPPWPEGPSQSWGHRVRALFSGGGSLRF